MVASKIVSSSGFCWADEVEKEEEEEEIRHHRRRERERSGEKPNPFGSARPREVVLQEKGIDWRQLDSTPRKEKQPENVPASTGPSGGKKRWSPRNRDLEPNVEYTRHGWGRETGISSGSLTDPDQNVDSLVPPLRYPPKNIGVLMKEKQWPENFYKADASLSSYKEFHGEKQREDMIPEFGMQPESKRLDSSFRSPHHHRYSDHHDRETEWDKGNPYIENRQGELRREKSPMGRQEKEWKKMDYHPSDRHLENPYTENRQGEPRREKSPLVHQEKEWKKMDYHPSDGHLFDERLPVEDRRRTNNESWDDGGYGYGRTSGVRERFRRSPSFNEPPSGERLRYRPYDKEGAFRGNYRSAGARPLEERGNGNMDYFSGRQRYDTKEFEGSHTGRVDRGRAESHRDMDMDKPDFRRNNRNNIGGNYRNVGVRPFDQRRPEKMDHLYGKQRFDAKEFDASRTRSMDRGRAEYHPDRDSDRGRAEYHPDRDTDRAGFGSNYKKRGMESRPNTSHEFQRRRR